MRLPFALLVTIAMVGTAACGGDGDGDGGQGSVPPPPPPPAVTDGTVPPPGPAATATEAATPAPSMTPGEPVTQDANQPAVRAARQDLADRFERDVSDITVLSVTRHVWPDTCLGVTLTNEDEPAVCAQVLTPGYEIKLRLSESVYTFRTDEDGAVVRFADLEFSAED
jgi:hypothetical protein